MTDIAAPLQVTEVRRDLRSNAVLARHLVGREMRLRYRRTRFGLLWGVIQPLIRFGVMGFVFGAVAQLGIPNYAQFLFIGILVWTWFSSGITQATNSAVDRPELTGRPGLPRVIVPLVAVVTALMDMLLAFPILLVVLLFTGGVPWTAVALPVLIGVQALLVIGLGLVGCASNVYYRDTKPIVETVMTVGFYAVPIVYSIDMAPAGLQPFLERSPVAIIIEAYRSILIYGELPELWPSVWATTCSVAALVVGWLVFRRASPNFMDEI